MARVTRIGLQIILLCSTLLLPARYVCGQSEGQGETAATHGHLLPNAVDAKNWANWQEVRGVTYVPTYARNATEVWTRFDAEVLDRELGFAERLGLNTIRFFVDVRAYEADPKLMLARLDQFLALCEKHNMRVIPQLFDSCGTEEADLSAAGQACCDPQTGEWFDVHWRSWISNPGLDRMGPEHWAKLDKYIQAIVGAHLKDDRILLWEVVNEPWCMARWDNPKQRALIRQFIGHFCKVVRTLKPEAPITVGLTTLDRADIVEDWVDVVSFHIYQRDVDPKPQWWVSMLKRAQAYSKRTGKPVLLTELGHPAWGVQGGRGRSFGDEKQRAFYEQILPVVEQSKIGWCIFDLIMGYGPFAHTSVLKPNGDERPAATIIKKHLRDRKALADWKKANRRLTTRWAKDVSPEAVLPEYPRPQMVRDNWLNLNGTWEYAIAKKGAPRPNRFGGEILVPFPIESALSGVGRRVTADDRVWYRRSFQTPDKWSGQRVLLHFGAVDWETTVWVNGKQVGTHRGGYDPFTFDITDALSEASSQEIVVRVWDPSDQGTQPRGKQRRLPGRIWYTPSSGPWQTVWLEPIPQTSIDTLKLTPNVDAGLLELTVKTRGPHKGYTVEVVALDGDREIGRMTGGAGELLQLKIKQAKLWSPDSPFLYGLRVNLLKGNKPVDQVTSYFGMRKISLGNDGGITRILLNNEPLFQFGPLDQGFWPDGLYTAPTDEALRYDLEITKKLGFNMVRKHVKVEPARWYYWCDKLGLLVWQDMPNGDKQAAWPLDGQEIDLSADSAEQHRRELKALIDACYNHPSIVMWVPFNEAWGQFDTVEITDWVKQYDPSRLVNSASGGNDFSVGDVKDDHFYPGPGAPPAERQRAAVLGEFGGLGLPIAGHTWQDKKSWGYRSFTDRNALTDAYLDLITKLRPLVESRLSAAIYTQTTDVEFEVNGLVTYDRARVKMDVERIADANRKLYLPRPTLDSDARVAASTLAYWRFEDGKPGKAVRNVRATPLAIGTRDVSGHNNHLYAYAASNAPKFGSDVPQSIVSSTGLVNRGSLDDSAAPTRRNVSTRDLYTAPDRPHSSPVDQLNAFPLREWTIEASFKLSRLGRTHGIVGKDGKPTAGPAAPLQLTVDGSDNRIEIQAIDSTGTVHRIRSQHPVEMGHWYHVAAVCDGATLKLFVDRNDGHGYQQQGQTEFVGPLVNNVGDWSVGRGFDNGHIGRDARAVIDEVRISTVALPKDLFVFAPKLNEKNTNLGSQKRNRK